MKTCFTILISLCMIAPSLLAQNAKNIFTYQVGSYKVSTLSETQGEGNQSILIGATTEILEKYTKDGTFPNAVNAFLVQTPDQNILIDAGYGRNLFNNLKTLGVSPEQIDVILVTHMHGDHLGGLLVDGEVAFPNAQLYLPKPEHDYWMDDDARNRMPEDRRGGFDGARNVIDAYEAKLDLFDPSRVGDTSREILPGLYGMEAYGHTPGHSIFLIHSGNSRLLIWGDLTHAMAVQMPHPEIAVTYDVNPQNAINARQKVLKYVSEQKIPVAGMHIAYPAMGTITASETGYTFTNLK